MEPIQKVADPAAQAIGKTIPAVLPGAVTLLAGWLDVLNTIASIGFLTASLAFLLWRWRKAYVRNKKREGEE